MYQKITLTFYGDEVKALMVLAQREYRGPREQAALIIRQELERRGLLQPTPPPALFTLPIPQAG